MKRSNLLIEINEWIKWINEIHNRNKLKDSKNNFYLWSNRIQISKMRRWYKQRYRDSFFFFLVNIFNRNSPECHKSLRGCGGGDSATVESFAIRVITLSGVNHESRSNQYKIQKWIRLRDFEWFESDSWVIREWFINRSSINSKIRNRTRLVSMCHAL